MQHPENVRQELRFIKLYNSLINSVLIYIQYYMSCISFCVEYIPLMTQKLILSVAMYSYLCIALLIMCEVAISDSLICVILNTNVAEIDCSFQVQNPTSS